MKSKDEVSSENFFMRIGGMVKDRDAYRWEDPRLLCENGHLEYEEKGVLKPFFKTTADILRSENFTMHVPRLYYDTMTTIGWREAKKWIDILRINYWKIAKEIEEIDFTSMKRAETSQRDGIEAA